METIVKHPTASVFLFDRPPCVGAGGVEIGLIHHPRLGKWMIPGGHVEANENPAQAAAREVAEETGLAVEFVISESWTSPPPLLDAVRPLWVVEQEVPSEAREPRPHIHVDHLFVAVAVMPIPGRRAELSFAWFGSSDLHRLDMFPETRRLALHLLDPANGVSTAIDPDPDTQ